MKTNARILRKYSAILSMIIVLAAALPLVACVKELEEPEESVCVPTEPDETEETADVSIEQEEPEETAGIITMTTQDSKVSLQLIVKKDISIDWGDGKKSNLNDASFFEEVLVFYNEYSGTTEHKILITGNVTQLSCGVNLTKLDVSKNPALTRLDCRGNQLTTLDVSKNTALEVLRCDQNRLTDLDVSKNIALKILECNYNQLTILDVSNTSLMFLSVVGNQFSASALNNLFRTLPDYSKDNRGNAIYISERAENVVGNPGILDCDRSIAEERGWHFRSLR